VLRSPGYGLSLTSQPDLEQPGIECNFIPDRIACQPFHRVLTGRIQAAAASFADFAQAGQRVGRFAALRDGEHQRVVVQRRIAVAQLAGVFHFHRDPAQFFDNILRHQTSMPAGSAGYNNNTLCCFKCFDIILNPTHGNSAGSSI
jgi:hypothetical protein